MPMPIFLLRGPPRQEGATHDECLPRQTRHFPSLLATSMQTTVKLSGTSRTLSDNVTWHQLATEITWRWTALYLDLGSVEKRRFKCHDESCHSLRRTRWRWRQEPCALLVRGRAASRIGDSHGDSIVSGKRSLVTSIIRLDTKCTTVVLLAFEPPRDGNSEEPSMQGGGPCRPYRLQSSDPCAEIGLLLQMDSRAKAQSVTLFGLDSKLYFWHAKPPVALSLGFVLGLERLIVVARPNLGRSLTLGTTWYRCPRRNQVNVPGPECFLSKESNCSEECWQAYNGPTSTHISIFFFPRRREVPGCLRGKSGTPRHDPNATAWNNMLPLNDGGSSVGDLPALNHQTLFGQCPPKDLHRPTAGRHVSASENARRRLHSARPSEMKTVARLRWMAIRRPLICSP
ncbi:hypothetical protein VDGL01_05039 [Verticillium dahliae]